MAAAPADQQQARVALAAVAGQTRLGGRMVPDVRRGAKAGPTEPSRRLAGFQVAAGAEAARQTARRRGSLLNT